MLRFALAAAVLSLVAAPHAALAQDPVKVSPNLYKVLLENDQVRVLEYNVKPGDKEPLHSHVASVVYVLTGGKAKETTPDGKSQIFESKAGQTMWYGPATHTWEHLGPGNAKVLIVEMKKPAPSGRKATGSQ